MLYSSDVTRAFNEQYTASLNHVKEVREKQMKRAQGHADASAAWLDPMSKAEATVHYDDRQVYHHNTNTLTGRDMLKYLHKSQRDSQRDSHRKSEGAEGGRGRQEASALASSEQQLREDILDRQRVEIRNRQRAIVLALRDKRNTPDPKSLQAMYSGLNLHKSKSEKEIATLKERQQESFLRVTGKAQEDEDELEDDGDVLSDPQVELVIKFIESCQHNESTKEITLSELEAAFRKHRFSVQSKANETYCRELMGKFESLLTLNQLTLESWFQVSDTRGGLGGDGKVSHLELVESVEMLCKRANASVVWSKRDILLLLRFMDPDGDGDLTLVEARSAFRRYKAPPEYREVLKQATPIMSKLDGFMRRKKIRVKDLFRSIDIDQSDSVSFAELKKALHKMFGGPESRKKESDKSNRNTVIDSKFNNVSKKFLKEAKENRHKNALDFSTKIFEEAMNLQREIATCINEANIYAELLHRDHRFRLVSAGDDAEEARWQQLVDLQANLGQGQGAKVKGLELPIGTSLRLEKTLVETFDVATGLPSGTSSRQDFLREHAMLRKEVKKYKSVLTTTSEEEKGVGRGRGKNSREKGEEKDKNKGREEQRTEVRVTDDLLDFPQFRDLDPAGLSEAELHTAQLRAHLQVLLEDAVRHSTAMERQAEAVRKAGWNLM